ncbi:MAG: hypothetical protein GC165_00150 [Armatimonadetes bacterium]|nr:hypothetical protein [Armatimonadota bacterium]
MEFDFKQYIFERCSAVVVHAPGYKRPLGIYSGFFVDIEGQWFWLTAAHCKTEIRETIENWPTCEVDFLTYLGGGSEIAFCRDDCTFVDFQEINKTQMELNGPLGEDEARIADLFDVACLPVPDTVVCYLLNKNVATFALEEFGEDVSKYHDRKRVDAAIFCCGIPGSSFELEGTEATVRPRLFPLHPEPNEDINPEKVDLEQEFYVWIPVNFVSEGSNESLQGVSGGPVLMVIENKDVRVIGIQTRERPGNGGKSVGVCPLNVVVERLQSCVQEFIRLRNERVAKLFAGTITS